MASPPTYAAKPSGRQGTCSASFIAAWRAEAAENSSDKLLPECDEALATERDEQRRRNLQDTGDWLAAGNPVGACDSSMRSYDAVLAEIPALLGLLDDEELQDRTLAAYLLARFPDLADISVPLLLDLAAREHDGVAKATSLVAVGILGTPALAPALAVELDAEDDLVRWPLPQRSPKPPEAPTLSTTRSLCGPLPNSLPRQQPLRLCP